MKGVGVDVVIIRKAAIGEAKQISDFIDEHFTKDGYGFVTDAQTKTEVARGSVFVAFLKNEIVGVRVGINRVYNLCVHKNHRGCGIGRQLINIFPPETIRVKSEPVGNLSKKQKDGFTIPDPFYQSLGYVFSHKDTAKNFHQKGKDGEKAHFHKEGKKHIRVYRKPKNELIV